MGSIFYLIAIIGLNLVLKNAQEKRKRENDRNRRVQDASKKAMESKRKSPSALQELYDLLNANLDGRSSMKEVSQEKAREKKEEIGPIKKEERPDYQKKEWLGSQASVTESTYKDFSSEHYERGGHKEVREMKEAKEKKRQEKLDERKKDIVRGIIFSEILSKPKSLR